MVARVQVKNIATGDLYLNRLPEATRKAFLSCIKLPLLRQRWYLAGGTARALQVGHRQSVDLDFFTQKKTFRKLEVERALLNTGNWKTTYIEAGTIYGTYLGAKMSLIAYPFFIPSVAELRCGTVRILPPEDIGAMKIIAISQRGRKRDFVDLYWYCTEREPLSQVVLRALSQYPGQEKNLNHIIKSLAYFADAEDDIMPKTFFNADWKKIKKYFQREAPKLVSIKF